MSNLLFSDKLKRSDLLNWTFKSDLRSIEVNIFRNHSFELVESLIGPFLDFAGLRSSFNYSDYDDSLNFSINHNSDLNIIWLDLERYKIIKIKVIRNTFLKQNADAEIKALREIRNEFNNLIMDDVMLESIEDGDRENPYIKEFEYLFIEQLVKQAEPNMVISISNLKIILDN